MGEGDEMTAGAGLRIVVLLPCYNEEAAIGRTVAAFRAALPEAVVYVFDNNCTDRTAASRSAILMRTASPTE